MNQKTIQAFALATITLVAVLCAARPGRAQDAENPYPASMAPLDQYLITDLGTFATVHGPEGQTYRCMTYGIAEEGAGMQCDPIK